MDEQKRYADLHLEIYRLTLMATCILAVAIAYTVGKAVYAATSEGWAAVKVLTADVAVIMALCGLAAVIFAVYAAAYHFCWGKWHVNNLTQLQGEVVKEQLARTAVETSLKERLQEQGQLQSERDALRQQLETARQELADFRQQQARRELQFQEFLVDRAGLPYVTDPTTKENQLDIAALMNATIALPQRWRDWQKAGSTP